MPIPPKILRFGDFNKLPFEMREIIWRYTLFRSSAMRSTWKIHNEISTSPSAQEL